MWNFGGRVIRQCISYGRFLKVIKGLNWMWCCFMGSNLLQMRVLMPGVAHGHNEGMMMYVGLKNGCRLIWGKLCAFFLYHTAHM
jgi:hypothetical protein